MNRPSLMLLNLSKELSHFFKERKVGVAELMYDIAIESQVDEKQ